MLNVVVFFITQARLSGVRRAASKEASEEGRSAGLGDLQPEEPVQRVHEAHRARELRLFLAVLHGCD